ncbi:hypothetical protein [Desulfonatronovibrio hydrogenovorans]|uniref:hypothetical protein n=1 Tax=Desulfonatronovibrio hydrogenovorans TaxID=53245 RepID=UPI00048EEBF7|nr:hypothetical protein [Desulfonatronovibrio hydrogenovorans]
MSTFIPFFNLKLTFRLDGRVILPVFTGPAWSAVIRRGLKRYLPPDFSQANAGVMPVPFSPGPGPNTIHLGLILPEVLARPVLEMLWDFNSLGGSGYLRPGINIHLVQAQCQVSSAVILEHSKHDILWQPELARPVTPEVLEPRIAELQHWKGLNLKLITPLRTPRPAGAKEDGHRYCDPDYFHDPTNDLCLGHLAGKVRYLDLEQELLQVIESGPVLSGSELNWTDIPYGRGIPKTLGGVTGKLTFTGRLSRRQALALALGEHTGLGKNGSFGLGFYRLQPYS